MKRALKALLVLPLLIGCVAPLPADDVTRSRARDEYVPVESPTDVNQPSFTMTLPGKGWSVENKGTTFIAKRDPYVIAIAAVKIDASEVKPEEFGQAVAFLQMQDKNVQVFRALPADIDNRPGAVLIISDNNMLMLEYALGVDDRGYTLICGNGRLDEAAIKVCQPILSTFHIKHFHFDQ